MRLAHVGADMVNPLFILALTVQTNIPLLQPVVILFSVLLSVREQ